LGEVIQNNLENPIRKSKAKAQNFNFEAFALVVLTKVKNG